MNLSEPITFIVPIGNEETFSKCFLSSPLFTASTRDQFQILAQRGFPGVAKAFNDGLDKALHDLIVCLHQDVILPVNWANRFLGHLHNLEAKGAHLGAIGCIGCQSDGELVGHVYHRDRQLFPAGPLPARVQALDELLVAFRKSSGLRFDEGLPSFFGYAPDICMEADRLGLQNFVVDAPCIHETADRQMARRDIYPTWKFLQRKWRDRLPIHTPTGPIDGSFEFWKDMLKDHVKQAFGYSPEPWWAQLPTLKREEILFADSIPRM